MNEDLVKCSSCAEAIQSDAILCRFCQQPVSTSHFIACPRCAEMVQREAAICRYCGAGVQARIIMKPKSFRAFGVSAAELLAAEILGQLRQNGSTASILEFAIGAAVRAFDSDRGFIWQIAGDRLVATNEFDREGRTSFADANFGAQESQAIMSEFLSRFPDESGHGAFVITDFRQDTMLRKTAPTLVGLLELANVRSMLVVQLRWRGMFLGFLVLQQSSSTRSWSDEDASSLHNIAQSLSCVVQQSLDLSRIEMHAQQTKLINEIFSQFRESKAPQGKEPLSAALNLVAERMSFTHSQILLINEEGNALVSQTGDALSSTVPLSSKDNPFVAVYESGEDKVINAEPRRRGDPHFGHDTALILPLISEENRFGVLVLWRPREEGKSRFINQDRELGITIASVLAGFVHLQKLKRLISPSSSE
ncbi:MAG: zinc ribbon domain-containing protein [Candidatus Obscuribacterales bacterium]|nr:zinc ribbon domain-containing protein [Candidatus Obscuribacterales bacterium]